MAKLICELGINHDGSYIQCKKLIDIAKSSNAWGIKFQYRNLKFYKETNNSEIGNEIINKELKKNHLSIRNIKSLANYARSINLKAGCSFFSKNEELDFKDFLFDFYKVPSVSSLDLTLIKHLKTKKKLLFISTGSLKNEEIEYLAKEKFFDINTAIFHCISNYPLNPINAQLAMLNTLKKKFPKSSIGYSSHENNIFNCLLALGNGVDFIERHITLNKQKIGLDHSSSSDPKEIKTLGAYCKNLKIIFGDGERIVNQGEKINRQSLGKSAYAKKNFKKGTILRKKDIHFRPPQIGYNERELEKYFGKKIQKQIDKNQVLDETIVTKNFFNNSHFKLLNKLNVSIPIRPHDYENFMDEFNLNNFEFHLTFQDLNLNEKRLFKNKKILKNKRFSVHAPDYIDSNNVLDIFSKNKKIKNKSIKLIEKSIIFAKKLSNYSGFKVNLISSFSTNSIIEKKKFYKEISNKIKKWKKRFDIDVLPQWLPPFGWYFGGVVKINYFNDPNDFELIKKNKIFICLDTSHFLLSCNYYVISPNFYFSKFFSIFKHFHISDAKGIDGEGLEIGKGLIKKTKILKRLLKSTNPKVLEVWQGHLNRGRLFKKEMKKILSL